MEQVIVLDKKNKSKEIYRGKLLKIVREGISGSIDSVRGNSIKDTYCLETNFTYNYKALVVDEKGFIKHLPLDQIKIIDSECKCKTFRKEK